MGYQTKYKRGKICLECIFVVISNNGEFNSFHFPVYYYCKKYKH